MSQGKVGTAVVIGAGAIGIEMAEAMTDLWGISTHLFEMEKQILPTLLGEQISRVAEHHLTEKGVKLHLQDCVTKITQDETTGSLLVATPSETIQTDIVIFATGVRPQTAIAVDAGIAVGSSGGILVNSRMQTSDKNIYAGGDCVEIRNEISGENMLMALGSLANRQGRIIAGNIAGKALHFRGGVGTFCIKIFDLGIAKAGLTRRQAQEAGFDPITAVISQADRAHFYPGFEFIYIALIGDRKTRRILGIEAVGANGDAVKARVDAVAVLLQHDITVDDICSLEVSYAPPYASAMDAVNNAGNTLDNIIEGRDNPIAAHEFLHLFKQGEIQVLDVRGAKDAAPFVEKYGEKWLNIPLDTLRKRKNEIPRDRELYLLCDTGARSYESQVILSTLKAVQTRNIQGGVAMIKMLEPSFVDFGK